MTDPLLSTLCTICRIEQHKYKCPRCSARTCSLACTQKHKVRAVCNGQRNPTAFVPLARLRTAAGIDHDYNFLVGIERSRSRVEKEIVDEKQLLNVNDVRCPEAEDDKRFDKVWYGDELRHVLVEDGRHSRQPVKSHSPFARFLSDKKIRRRLNALDIEVSLLPQGMTRARENQTAFNRRTKNINWQVECFFYLREQHQPETPKRLMGKVLDTKPMNGALAYVFAKDSVNAAGTTDQLRHSENAVHEDGTTQPDGKRGERLGKERKPALHSQQWPTSFWPAGEVTLQTACTGKWNHICTGAFAPAVLDECTDTLAGWQFFLQDVNHSRGQVKSVIPVGAMQSLADCLSGRNVIEFPTIYVLPPGMALPDDLALSSSKKRKRERKPESKEAGPRHERGQKRAALKLNGRPSQVLGRSWRSAENKGSALEGEHIHDDENDGQAAIGWSRRVKKVVIVEEPDADGSDTTNSESGDVEAGEVLEEYLQGQGGLAHSGEEGVSQILLDIVQRDVEMLDANTDRTPRWHVQGRGSLVNYDSDDSGAFLIDTEHMPHGIA